MHRSPRFVLLSCAALLVAALTAFVVVRDLNVLRQRAATLGPLRSVVVAVHDLELGAVLRADDLRTADVYERAIPAGALVDPADAVGRVVAVPVPHDAFVHDAHLLPPERTGIDGLIPPERRAVRVTSVDGLAPPVGSVVDVLAVLDPAFDPVSGTFDSGHASAGATRAARGARVLAVDTTDDAAFQGSGGPGVTLLVTEEEARAVAFSAANGVLTLALAPPEAACC